MKIMPVQGKDKSLQNNPDIVQSIDDLVLDHCPSCYQTLKPKAVECMSCGIVLENYRRSHIEKKLKHTIGGLYHLTSEECIQLEKTWAKIETVYYDQNLHNQFLHACLRLKSLPYAVKKYQGRLNRDSLDEIASIMKNRAMLLASESLPTTAAKGETWAPPILAQALLRTLIVVLIVGTCAGSVLMLISALTVQKLFFFALGSFLTASCLLSAMSLLRIQRSL